MCSMLSSFESLRRAWKMMQSFPAVAEETSYGCEVQRQEILFGSVENPENQHFQENLRSKHTMCVTTIAFDSTEMRYPVGVS